MFVLRSFNLTFLLQYSTHLLECFRISQGCPGISCPGTATSMSLPVEMWWPHQTRASKWSGLIHGISWLNSLTTYSSHNKKNRWSRIHDLSPVMYIYICIYVYYIISIYIYIRIYIYDYVCVWYIYIRVYYVYDYICEIYGMNMDESNPLAALAVLQGKLCSFPGCAGPGLDLTGSSPNDFCAGNWRKSMKKPLDTLW